MSMKIVFAFLNTANTLDRKKQKCCYFLYVRIKILVIYCVFVYFSIVLNWFLSDCSVTYN